MSDISDGLIDDTGSVADLDLTESRRQQRSVAHVCTDQDILIIRDIVDRADASDDASSFLSVIQAYNTVLSSLHLQSSDDFVYFPILLALSRIRQDSWNERLDFFLNHASDLGFTTETAATSRHEGSSSLMAQGEERVRLSLKGRYLRKWMLATLHSVRRNSRLKSIAEFNDSNTLVKEAWTAWRSNFEEIAKANLSADDLYSRALTNKYAKIWHVRTLFLVHDLASQASVFLKRITFRTLSDKTRSAVQLQGKASKVYVQSLLRKTFSLWIEGYFEIRCKSFRRDVLLSNAWRYWRRQFELQLLLAKKAVQYHESSLQERFFQKLVEKLVLCTERNLHIAETTYSKTLHRGTLKVWKESYELRIRENALYYFRDIKLEEKVFNVLVQEERSRRKATFFYLNHLNTRYLKLWRLSLRLEAEQFNREKQTLQHSLHQWQSCARLSAVMYVRDITLLSTFFRKWRDQFTNLKGVLSYAFKYVEGRRSKSLLINTVAKWRRKAEMNRQLQVRALRLRSNLLTRHAFARINQNHALYKSLQQTASIAFAVNLESLYTVKWRGAIRFYKFLLGAAEKYAGQRSEEWVGRIFHIWRCKSLALKFQKLQGKRQLDQWRSKLQTINENNAVATDRLEDLSNAVNREIIAHFLTRWRRQYNDIIDQYSMAATYADAKLAKRYLHMWISRKIKNFELHQRYNLYANKCDKQLLRDYFFRIRESIDHKQMYNSVATSYSDDILLEEIFKRWMKRAESISEGLDAADLFRSQNLLRLGWSHIKGTQRAFKGWVISAVELRDRNLGKFYLQLLQCKLRDSKIIRNAKSLETERSINLERYWFSRFREAFIFWHQVERSASEDHDRRLKQRSFYVWVGQFSKYRDNGGLADEWRKNYLMRSCFKRLWKTFLDCKSMSELASEVLEAQQYSLTERTVRTWKLAMFSHYDRQSMGLEFLENRLETKQKRILSEWRSDAYRRQHQRRESKKSYLIKTLEDLSRQQIRTTLERVMFRWQERLQQTRNTKRQAVKMDKDRIEKMIHLEIKHWRSMLHRIKNLQIYSEELYDKSLMESTFSLLMDRFDSVIALKSTGAEIWDRKVVCKAGESFGLWVTKIKNLNVLQNLADDLLAKHRIKVMADSLRLWRLELADLRISQVVNEAQCELALNRWKHNFNRLQVISNKAAEFASTERSFSMMRSKYFTTWKTRCSTVVQIHTLAERTCERSVLKHVFRDIYRLCVLRQKCQTFSKSKYRKSMLSRFIVWKNRTREVRKAYRAAIYFDQSRLLRISFVLFRRALNEIDRLEDVLETTILAKNELYLVTSLLVWRGRNNQTYNLTEFAQHHYIQNLEGLTFSKWKSQSLRLKRFQEFADQANRTSLCLNVINIWQSRIESLRTSETRARIQYQDRRKTEVLNIWINGYHAIEHMNLVQEHNVSISNHRLLMNIFILWRDKQQNLGHNTVLASKFYSSSCFWHSLDAWMNRFANIKRARRLCDKYSRDKEIQKAKNIMGIWRGRINNIQNNNVEAHEMLLRAERMHCVSTFHRWHLKAVSLQVENIANSDILSRYSTFWRRSWQELGEQNDQAMQRYNFVAKKAILAVMLGNHRALLEKTVDGDQMYKNNVVNHAVIRIAQTSVWCKQIKSYRNTSINAVKKGYLKKWIHAVTTHKSLEHVATGHYNRKLAKTSLSKFENVISLARMRNIQSIEVSEIHDLQRFQRTFRDWYDKVRVLSERKSLAIKSYNNRLEKKFFFDRLRGRWNDVMIQDELAKRFSTDTTERRFFFLIKTVFEQRQYEWKDLSVKHNVRRLLMGSLIVWREEAECQRMLKRLSHSSPLQSKVTAIALMQWRMALSNNDQRSKLADMFYGQIVCRKLLMRWQMKAQRIHNNTKMAVQLSNSNCKGKALKQWVEVVETFTNRARETQTQEAQKLAKVIFFRRLKIKLFVIKCNKRKAREFYTVWGSGNLERRVWIRWRMKMWQEQLDNNNRDSMTMKTPQSEFKNKLHRYSTVSAAKAIDDLPAHLASPSYRWRKFRAMMSEPGAHSRGRYISNHDTPTARRRLEFSNSESQ